MMILKTHLLVAGAVWLTGATQVVQAAPASSGAALDTIIFGDAASEKAHGLLAANTKTTTGALGEPARVSLPKAPIDPYGGDLTFNLHVDPVRQNYFTVKFWGDDLNDGQKALLYINGEQLGYRHMGDYEALNHGATEPSFRGRFFYYTDILPLLVTRGQQQLTLTIKTIGPISGYSLGGGYDGYQGKMSVASRGYYRAYTHLNPAIWGQDAEKQGSAPPAPPVRPAPKTNWHTALAAERATTNNFLNDRMRQTDQMQPRDINALAAGLALTWTDVGANDASRQAALTQLVAKIDDQCGRLNEPDIYARGSYQSDWGGHFAPIGEAIFRMNRFVSAAQWQTLLDAKINLLGETLTRREAWTRMLKGNFDYARTHIARITNQAEICMEGAYRSNKGLQIVNPAAAEPEITAKRFLFEALGISPYRGNDILDANGKLIGREDPFGGHYLQVTDKGLTREYTYVGIYGEATNVLVDWWELYGYDELLKKALVASDARAHMNYPDTDQDGFRAMRMEGVIESRGPSYPDSIGYGVRLNNGHGLIFARIERLMKGHPERYQGAQWAPYWKLASNAVGYAAQRIHDSTFNGEMGDDYAYVLNHAPVGVVLPNTNLTWYSSQELAQLQKAGLKADDYLRRAWTDEDDGIVVLRDGNTTLFVSLVQKAINGINGVSRVHCISPTYDRLGAAVPDVQFDWNGQYSVRPDWTNVQFTWGNQAPEHPFQVLEGEILPIATQPNVDNKNPHDSPYSGYANFYSLRYSPYLIGQNTTRAAYGNAKSYELKLPASFKNATVFDFVSGKEVEVKNGAVAVAPQSSVVVKLDSSSDERPPMAPRLVAVFGGANGTTVRWDHSGGATKYLVLSAASKSGPFAAIGETNGENSFVDATGKATDFYTVAGENDNGVGLNAPATPMLSGNPLQPIGLPNDANVQRDILNWLDKTPANPNGAPGTVSEFKGELIKRAVRLEWRVAKNAAGYEVLRANSENGPFIPVATNLRDAHFSQNGLDFGKTYFYRVVALNGVGERGAQSPAISFSPVDDTTPAPWKGVDIGEVGVEGSDGVTNGVFSIHGSGEDVWANRDEFRFVYQPLDGDGTIVTRVAAQENTSEWTKSGLMIRDSPDQNARNAFVFATPGHGVVFQTRADKGGGTNGSGSADGGVPGWLKLSRKGNLFTASTSKDGQLWSVAGTANIAMAPSVFVGLAVNAHSKGAMNLSRFENVQLDKG